MRRLTLEDGERVVTAFAERAHGPGWSNAPVWVIVAGLDGKLRQECLQPDQQTGEIGTLYNVSEATHRAMTSLVRLAVRVKRAA